MNSSNADLLRRVMLALLLGCVAAPATAAELAPPLVAAMARGDARHAVLLVFPEVDAGALAPLRVDAAPLTRRIALIERLRAHADARQAATRAWLDTQGITYRSHWISNSIAVTLDRAQLAALATRDDITRIDADTPARLELPGHEAAMPRPSAIAGIEPGVARIRAPEVWALGHTGVGVVVAGQDTGYAWTHPALMARYRGWDGTSVDHAYNWHDAIHEGASICGASSAEPCDDDDHGTHTMGTMLGDDGGSNRIGVAPGARWIGCRNMENGVGSPSRYIECMEWFLAPTNAAGLEPRPELAPDVINNSWACDVAEGCTTGRELDLAVERLVAGGIFFVAAAGNAGSGCASIHYPPATNAAAFVVGAVDAQDGMAGFSSRGPVAGGRVLPDLVAPGVGVRSAVRPDGYGANSGTSMATPHVAGVAALVMSVDPGLRGRPERVAAILRRAVVRDGVHDPHTSACGGIGIGTWPNHQAGHGRIDAYRAAILADTIFADGHDDS